MSTFDDIASEMAELRFQVKELTRQREEYYQREDERRRNLPFCGPEIPDIDLDPTQADADKADYIEHALGLLGVGPYKAACLWPEVVGLKSDKEIAAMSRGE